MSSIAVSYVFYNFVKSDHVSGDIGHIADNDCMVISDRLKELIKYKGLQV